MRAEVVSRKRKANKSTEDEPQKHLTIVRSSSRRQNAPRKGSDHKISAKKSKVKPWGIQTVKQGVQSASLDIMSLKHTATGGKRHQGANA